MNLLIKFPTRNRPDKFFQTLNQYVQSLSILEQLEGVDRQKLHATIQKIDNLIDYSNN